MVVAAALGLLTGAMARSAVHTRRPAQMGDGGSEGPVDFLLRPWRQGGGSHQATEG